MGARVMSTIQALTEAVIDRLFVPLEPIPAHIRLTPRLCDALLGTRLTGQRPLGHTGHYIANQRLTLTAPGGQQALAVVGPLCREVVLALPEQTLAALKMRAGEAPVTLTGPRGQLTLTVTITLLSPAVLLPPEAARRCGVSDGQQALLQIPAEMPIPSPRVAVIVREQARPVAFLPGPEWEKWGLRPGDLGRIVPCAGRC